MVYFFCFLSLSPTLMRGQTLAAQIFAERRNGNWVSDAAI
jgi:hypothetical protein